MPAEEAVVAKDEKALAAVLFMSAVMLALDTYSSINSSPWTAETFGADPDKAASCRRYVHQSVLISTTAGAISTWVAASPWPIVGVLAANAYMWWTYERALGKAAAEGIGADGWRAASGY